MPNWLGSSWPTNPRSLPVEAPVAAAPPPPAVKGTRIGRRNSDVPTASADVDIPYRNHSLLASAGSLASWTSRGRSSPPKGNRHEQRRRRASREPVAPAPRRRRRVVVEPVTPTIGAEISGVDLQPAAGLRRRSRRSVRRDPRMAGDVLPRPGPQQRSAQGLRPLFRPADARPSDLRGPRRPSGDLGALDRGLPHPPRRARHPPAQRASRRATTRAGTSTSPSSPTPTAFRSSTGSTIPPYGGDTLFANLIAAYEGLSPQDQGADRRPAGGAPDLELRRRRAQAAQGRPPHGSVRVAASRWCASIRRRGEKVLFFNAGTTTHIPGLKERESQALLDLLFHEVTRPEYQVRFRWRPNSLVVWDNPAVTPRRADRLRPVQPRPHRAPHHRRRRPAGGAGRLPLRGRSRASSSTSWAEGGRP